MIFGFLLLLIAITIPPAAKALVVIGAVYAVLQGLKKVPGLSNILQGWVAIAFNVALSACGLLVTIPPDQLYTTNTFLVLLSTILGAAGIHGTVTTMSSRSSQPPQDPPAQNNPAPPTKPQ